MPPAGADTATHFYIMTSTTATSLSLARKWRPQTFTELAGHEYAARVLQNAARQNRLHHAFLFTGTRGVGKTTLARIVAKTANCRDSKDGAPCLQCEMCTQIAAGRMLDVVELDAASHTQVDKMRELLEGAKYMPSQGRCKVFIIDEAHMLSKSAFAAMLKTLEEPPDYVKFVLATTDPQKLPATIMSRCLCFALRPLERRQIADRLREVLQAEERTFDEAAVQTIARLARGSMRDALSILEQALAAGGEKLEAAEARRIVGETDSGLVADMLRAVSSSDAAAIAGFAHRLHADGAGFDSALSRMAALLYKTALAKVAPDSAEDEEEAALVGALTPLFSEEELQTLYEIAVRGRRQLPWAPDEQTGFEMTLLRMTLFVPRRADAVSSPAEESTPKSAPANTDSPPVAKSAPVVHETDPWRRAMSRLSGSALALAERCTVREIDENGVILRADKSEKDNIPKMLPALESQLRKIFHGNFRVELQEGGDDAAADAHTRELTAAAMSRPFVRDVMSAMPTARISDIEISREKPS